MLRKIRRSLVLKTAILFAAAALVPLLVASAFFFRSARAALYGEFVSGLDARVGLMRDTLDARLAALRVSVLAGAGLDVMSDLLADDMDKRVTFVLEGLKRDSGLDGDMYALSADGRVVAASNRAAIGRRLPATALAGALGGQSTSADLHTSALDGLPVVAFVAPIRARAVDDGTIGVLLLEYHVRDLAASVLAGAVPLAAVIRPDGAVVAASSRWVPELEHVPDGARELGRFIVAKARHRGGNDFAGFGWTVVGAAERAQALAPVTRAGRFSLAAGLGAVALLVGLVAVAATRAIRPLTAVAGAADRIATTKDLSQKVPVSGDDEVGRVTQAFNRMVDEVNGQIDGLLEANIEMLEMLGSTIANRDSDTNAHNYRVTLMALRLAEASGLPRAELRALVKGSFLHDVGKVGISSTILLKPGKLDRAEFETMKTHVLQGTDIVGRHAWLHDAMDIVGDHHEKFDGTGYPAGLAGEAIPMNARIFAIADVFDTLTSARPYRAALSYEAALLAMRPGRGQHFDPALFDLFLDMAPTLYADICLTAPAVVTATLQQRTRRYFFH